ncbi:hypothetical protein NC651_017740 [Populus alba x Populus x berolinensis]|nr:hypothetical protein NC651_017740 [Populus alba x Populus x berolinensis]
MFFLSFHISYNALHRPIMARRDFICLSSRLKIINITIFDSPWPINLPLEHIKTTANLSFIGLVDCVKFEVQYLPSFFLCVRVLLPCGNKLIVYLND